MNDLHINFTLRGEETELTKLLQLACDLGYVTAVEITPRERMQSLGGWKVSDMYPIYDYEVVFAHEYAPQVLKNGLKDVLADDDQVQAAMNLTETEIIDLVKQIDW